MLYIWLMAVGLYFALRPMLGFFETNIETSPSKYNYRERSNSEEWRLKKFHKNTYRKIIALDTKWLEHEMDLLWHRLDIENCPFCPIHEKQKAQRKADKEAMTVRTDFSQGGDVKTREVRDMEILLYCQESPRMELEKGDEIVEMTASGNVCVTYETYMVKCMDCGDTRPHKHTKKELEKSQQAMLRVQDEINDFNQALLNSMDSGNVVPMLLPENQEKPVIRWPSPPPSIH